MLIFSRDFLVKWLYARSPASPLATHGHGNSCWVAGGWTLGKTRLWAAHVLLPWTQPSVSCLKWHFGDSPKRTCCSSVPYPRWCAFRHRWPEKWGSSDGLARSSPAVSGWMVFYFLFPCPWWCFTAPAPLRPQGEKPVVKYEIRGVFDPSNVIRWHNWLSVGWLLGLDWCKDRWFHNDTKIFGEENAGGVLYHRICSNVART